MEDFKKYCNHLPTCNLSKDWGEAEDALADTPDIYRDESWNEAYEELRRLKNTCTCGLTELLNTK